MILGISGTREGRAILTDIVLGFGIVFAGLALGFSIILRGPQHCRDAAFLAAQFLAATEADRRDGSEV